MADPKKAIGAVGALAAAGVGAKLLLVDELFFDLSSGGREATPLVRELGGAASSATEVLKPGETVGVQREADVNRPNMSTSPLTTANAGRSLMERQSDNVTVLFAQVQQNIIAQLEQSPTALSKDQLENIIKAEFQKELQQANQKPDSGVTFEVLTGSLKIEASTTIARVKVSAGEVNIYKVSTVLAGGFVSCAVFVGRPGFEECTKTAFARIGTEIANEMRQDSASNTMDKESK